MFDEFLRMQVGLVARKRALAAEESGIAHAVDGALVAAFLDALPFALTGDQRARDRRDHRTTWPSPAPMHRLLQGDVGSGKTVVALAALLIAVQGGYQGAFMAPTEVLAEQHYLASRALLDGLDGPAPRARCSASGRCGVELLTNRTTAAERRRIADGPRRAARSTSSSARTRCSTATPSSRSLGARGDRRAAPLRRRAARRCCAARATSPTCS